MENKRNLVEEELIPGSIDESSTEDHYYEKSISMNSLENIWVGKHVDTDINAIDARLKICDQIW